MSSFQAPCPGCQVTCTIPEAARGKNIRCPKCNAVFRAPEPTPPAPAEPKPVEAPNLNEGVQTKPNKVPSKAPKKTPPPIAKKPDATPPRPKQRERKKESVLPTVLMASGALGAVLLCGGLAVGVAVWFLRTPPDNRNVAQIPDVARPVGELPVPNVVPPPDPLNPGNPPIVDIGNGDPPAKKPPPAPVKFDFGGGEAFEIKRCPINGEQEERALPGTVRDIVVGGGGRFVIVSIPATRQIAIFDVNEAKVVKYLPVAEDDAILAAGMDKLFVCLPTANVIQRWNLRTFEREVSVPNPVNGNLKAACMGWASDGPLLLITDDQSKFVHPRTLQPLDLQTDNGQFQARLGPDTRPSGDGTVFTCMDHHSTVRVFTVRDGFVTQKQGGTSSFISAPGLDGSFICTMIGVYNTDMQELYPKTNQNGLIVSPFVASKQGRMFIRIGQGGHDGPKNFNFYMLGHDRAIAVMPNFVGFDSQRNTYAEGAGRLSADRRYNLLPNAEVLVALPATNDRLLLRKFNVRELLDKSGVDYLIVTSVAPKQATRGATYRYDMTVLAKKGGVKFKVESGPPGMKASDQGKLTWAVPADFGDAQVDVILTVSDAAGQETFHTFRIAVKDKAKGL